MPTPPLNSLGFTKDDLKRYVDSGYVSAKRHPELPLTIYCYTRKTVSERNWGAVTERCNGLILDDMHTIVAQPFTRVGYLGDTVAVNTYNGLWDLLWDLAVPTIFDHLDGTLGIRWTYFYNGTTHEGVATKEGFDTPDAKWATEWFLHHKKFMGTYSFNESFTYLFEIIRPENRSLCSYDYSGLVFIAAVRKNDRGDEFTFNDLRYTARRAGLRVPSRYFMRREGVKHAQTKDRPNKRGYILHFRYRDQWSGTIRSHRVAITHPLYTRLQKIMETFNPKSIWELVASGQSVDAMLLEALPTKFRKWAKGWADKLTADYLAVEEKAKQIFATRPEQHFIACGGVATCGTCEYCREYRKKVAECFNAHPEYSKILFCMLFRQDYAQIIWNMVKPKGDATLEELAA